MDGWIDGWIWIDGLMNRLMNGKDAWNKIYMQ
jgi:hypothetical protein